MRHLSQKNWLVVSSSLSTCVVYCSLSPRARFRLCNPAVHVWSALNLPGWMPGAPPSAQESRGEKERRRRLHVMSLTDHVRKISRISGAVHFLVTSVGRPPAAQVQGWKTNNIIIATLASSQVVHIAPDERRLTRVSKALGLPVFSKCNLWLIVQWEGNYAFLLSDIVA